MVNNINGWKAPRSKQPLSKQVLPPTKTKRSKDFVFEVKLPSFKLLDKRNFLINRRMASYGVLVGVAILVTIGGIRLLGDGNGSDGSGAKAAPDYKPLKSSASSSDDLEYDKQKAVTSYNDSIDGSPITVSQQPLSEAAKERPDEELDKIATNLNDPKVLTAGDTRAISSVAQSGYHTVVFSKNELLVFINSQKELDEANLVQYIINLR